MITALEQANLALRLVLEMLMLALVTLAAWRSPGAGASRVLRGAVAAVAAVGVMVVWAFVVHSTRAWPVRASVQVVLFGAAAWTLAGRRGQRVGGVFAGAVVVNAALMGVWDQ